MDKKFKFKGVAFDDVVDDRVDNGEDWDNKYDNMMNELNKESLPFDWEEN